MRIAILIFLLIATSRLCNAQLYPLNTEKYIDSLAHVAASTNSDSSKCRALFLLANYWSDYDSTKASHYLSQAKALVGNNHYLKALSHFYTGQVVFDKKTEYAISEYLLADSLLKKHNTVDAYERRYSIWKSYGILQQIKNNEAEYINVIANKCIPLATKLNNRNLLAESYVNMGIVFMNQVLYDKAAEYYDKAIALHSQQPLIDDAYTLYAYLHAAQNLLSKRDVTNAKHLLDTCKRLLQLYPASFYSVQYYNNEGIYFRIKRQYAFSIESLDKGITLAKKINRLYEAQSLLFFKFKTYAEAGNHEKAKNILLHIVNNPYYLLQENLLRYYHHLAEEYHHLKNDNEAYRWQTKALHLLDSLYESDIRNNITEYDAKYKTSEKEKQILSLQKEKIQANLSAKNNRLYNWLLGAGCLLFLIIAAASYIYYKKNRKISEHQLKEIKQQQELQLTQAMLEGEERERQRVARDLHDGLGGMLAGVKINLSRQSEMKSQNLDAVINQLDQSVSELRRIARNMMPESLLKIGLEAALQDLCESLQSNQTTIDFQAYNISKEMPAATQANIYRIVQEILSNAIRHANANSIILQCSQNGYIFFITAEDDGVGFNTSQLDKEKGMGMNNIQNRVKYFNGKLDIASRPGDGTTINIELNVSA